MSTPEKSVYLTMIFKDPTEEVKKFLLHDSCRYVKWGDTREEITRLKSALQVAKDALGKYKSMARNDMHEHAKLALIQIERIEDGK